VNPGLNPGLAALLNPRSGGLSSAFRRPGRDQFLVVRPAVVQGVPVALHGVDGKAVLIAFMLVIGGAMLVRLGRAAAFVAALMVKDLVHVLGHRLAGDTRPGSASCRFPAVAPFPPAPDPARGPACLRGLFRDPRCRLSRRLVGCPADAARGLPPSLPAPAVASSPAQIPEGKPMPIAACIFDAYGTLFDVAAAAREAAAQPENAAIAESWPRLATDWRQKQLEYSWLRAITGEHRDFWAVTRDGLDWALDAQGLRGDADLRERLLALYWQLPAYPEVPEVLARLQAAGIATAILSNGSPAMLDAAVRSAGVETLLDDVISVERVGIFKPAPQVYELVTTRFSCARDAVLFVSANGWDAAAAAGFGFLTAWINRAGAPQDRLGHPPHEELPDLATIPDIASAL
jgi:2-haloacid dehalogenase